MIEHVGKTKVEGIQLRIDIALRNEKLPIVMPNSGVFEQKNGNFYFDKQNDGKPALDQDEQIWCIDLHLNANSSPDVSINNPWNIPAQNSELAVFAKSMEV